MENELNGAENDKENNRTKGLERVNGFSDAVFAVAITLLILGIDVPVVKEVSELPSELTSLWPKFLAFIISFALIGFFWVAHHLMFSYLKRYSPGLLWLNLLFLMFIVFLPFSTALMSEYDTSKLAVIFYDANMALASLSLFLLWWYISRGNRLVKEDLDPATRKHLMTVYLNMSIIFLICMGLAAWNISASQYAYLILIPNSMLLEHIHKKNRTKLSGEGGRSGD
ncbi:MAG: TMEM175 family protein [Actinomycetota bacterium]|nr:TMEM175 family protein [Actinomycetota bacterium]